MTRIQLEEAVTNIIKRSGRPKAIAWLRTNYGVATFAKLKNHDLERFIKDHA